MGQLQRHVDRANQLEVRRQLSAFVPMMNQSQTSRDLNGKAEVVELNADGTVDVKFNGTTLYNIQNGGKPVGLGSVVILQAGQRIVN